MRTIVPDPSALLSTRRAAVGHRDPFCDGESKPVPRGFVEKNGSPARARTSADIPGPLSAMEIVVCEFSPALGHGDCALRSLPPAPRWSGDS
jgi:hypothetical protein